MDDKTLYHTAQKRAQEWLQDNFDEATRLKVKSLLESESEGDRKELIDAFYKDIDFGTGGVRGLMGVGTNRINRYTLSRVTRGLINFANNNFPSQALKVVIACDTRNNSELYSQEVAEIFSKFGAEVYRFQEAMPTPLLSYAVRKLGCQIGIVITASHNPKEYNGYKVYFDDGSQIVAPWDRLIIDEVNRVSSFVDDSPPKSGKITEIAEEVIKPYSEDTLSLIKSLSCEADFSFPMVYSSIHGTGGKLIIPLLQELGFKNVDTVPSQMVEDGNFPTVVYPNPEEEEALSLGLKVMEEKQAGLLMGTDPDTDRLGVAVRGQAGKPLILNGNQIGVLLADFLLSAYAKTGMPSHPFLVRTIVTTPLIDSIAEEYGLELFRVLTGFKYIGELIRKYEGEKQFLFGLEESHGYLATDKVRDKDAVSSALLFALMAAHYHKQGITVYQRLCEIYRKYGFCFEALTSFTKTGPEGKQEIEAIMSQIRESYSGGSKTEIVSERLARYRDYSSGYEIDLLNDKKNKIDLPPSNVIQIQTEKDTLITVRPSGTEPKIKFYFSVRIPLSESGDIFAGVGAAEKLARDKIEELKKVFVHV